MRRRDFLATLALSLALSATGANASAWWSADDLSADAVFYCKNDNHQTGKMWTVSIAQSYFDISGKFVESGNMHLKFTDDIDGFLKARHDYLQETGRAGTTRKLESIDSLGTELAQAWLSRVAHVSSWKSARRK